MYHVIIIISKFESIITTNSFIKSFKFLKIIIILCHLKLFMQTKYIGYIFIHIWMIGYFTLRNVEFFYLDNARSLKILYKIVRKIIKWVT